MLSFFVSRSLVFRVSLGVFGTAIYVNRNKLTMIIPGCLNILAFIGLTRNTICQETRIFGSRSMWCRHLEEKKYVTQQQECKWQQGSKSAVPLFANLYLSWVTSSLQHRCCSLSERMNNDAVTRKYCSVISCVLCGFISSLRDG